MYFKKIAFLKMTGSLENIHFWKIVQNLKMIENKFVQNFKKVSRFSIFIFQKKHTVFLKMLTFSKKKVQFLIKKCMKLKFCYFLKNVDFLKFGRNFLNIHYSKPLLK